MQAITNNLLFQTLAEAIPQLVWSTDASGQYDYFNTQFYLFTGLKPDEILGPYRPIVIHPDDDPEVKILFQLCLASGEQFEAQYRMRHVTDGYRWVLARAVPVKDEEGKIVRWFGTCTDIHDAKQEHIERTVLAEELKHRLRNTFSVVSGVINMAARHSPEHAQFAKDISSRLFALLDASSAAFFDADKGGSSTVHALLKRLSGPYMPAQSQGIAPQGQDNELGAKSTSYLALVLYELMTNSAKYGAFSNGSALPEITTRHQDGQYHLLWLEPITSPKPTETYTTGFGSKLIDISIKTFLGGSYEREITNSHFKVAIAVPVENLRL